MACTDTRPPPRASVDAGAPHMPRVSGDEATRVVQRFLVGIQSSDRAAVGETLASARLAEAIERPGVIPLGPERHLAFRDALVSEIFRDEWRAQYAGASVLRFEPRKPPDPVVVVITLDGGAERRAEIAHENSKSVIVRVY